VTLTIRVTLKENVIDHPTARDVAVAEAVGLFAFWMRRTNAALELITSGQAPDLDTNFATVTLEVHP
jgi:hypothetical protein